MKIQSRFVLVLSLLSIIHFLFSCGICSKKVDCPGFDEKAFANWMPYQDNSILIFQDSLFEKDTFTLRNKLTSTPYTSNTYSENRNPCHSQKLLCSDEQDTLSSKMCINLQINTIKTA